MTRLPAHLVAEKEEFVYRSYIALGQYSIILSEIRETPSTPIALRAVKLLANFFADPASRPAANFQLEEWLKDPALFLNPSLRLIAAIVNLHEDNSKEALRNLRFEKTWEQSAMMIQVFLRMDRPDLAKEALKKMKSKDEDNVLCQLATAWIALSPGGKAQDAVYVYEELIDKYGSSASLLNGLAVAKMHAGSFEEAETHLLEALRNAPLDPDSLANLICVSQHLDKPPEVVNRYVAQLQTKSPGHPLIVSLGLFDGAFDRVAASLA